MKKQMVAVGVSTVLSAGVLTPFLEGHAASLEVKAGKLVDKKSGKRITGLRVFNKKLYKNGVLYKAKTVIGKGSKRTLYVKGILAKGTQTASNGALLFKAGKLAKGTVSYNDKKTLYVNGVRAKGMVVYKSGNTSYLYRNGVLMKGKVQFNANKALYINGVLAKGVVLYKADGVTYLYKNGVWSKKTQLVSISNVNRLFVKGLQAKGTVIFEGKLYVDGLLAKGVQQYNGTYYSDGVVANGKIQDVVYVDGQLKVELEMKQLQEDIASLQSSVEDFAILSDLKPKLDEAIADYKKKHSVEEVTVTKKTATPQTNFLVITSQQTGQVLLTVASGIRGLSPAEFLQLQALSQTVDGQMTNTVDAIQNGLSSVANSVQLIFPTNVYQPSPLITDPMLSDSIARSLGNLGYVLAANSFVNGVLSPYLSSMNQDNFSRYTIDLTRISQFLNNNVNALNLTDLPILTPSTEAPHIVSISSLIPMTVKMGQTDVSLPTTVSVLYSNDTFKQGTVSWSPLNTQLVGNQKLVGTVFVDGVQLQLQATLDVTVEEDLAAKELQQRVAKLRAQIETALASMKPVSETEDGEDVTDGYLWTTVATKETYTKKLQLIQQALTLGTFNATSIVKLENDFNNARAIYEGGIQSNIDFSGLMTYIEMMRERLEKAVVIEDASEIPEDTTWILKSDKEEVERFLTKCDAMLKETNITQAQLDEAAEQIEKMINRFNLM